MGSRVSSSYRSRIRLLLLFCLCISVFGPVSADYLETADGKKYHTAWVESFAFEDGNPRIFVRLKTTRQFSEPHPVELSHIKVLEFRAASDLDIVPEGRPASLYYQDGRIFESVTLLSLKPNEDGAVLEARMEGTGAGSVFEVPVDKIDRIDFHQLPIYRMYNPFDRRERQVMATPTPRPTPVRTPVPQDPFAVFNPLVPNPAIWFADDPNYVPPAEPVQTPVPTSASENTQPKVEEPDEIVVAYEEPEENSYGDFSDEPWYTEEEDPPFIFRPFMVPFLNFGIHLVAFLTYLLCGSLAGGIFLKVTANLEAIPDFGWGKALTTAAVLAIFPPLMFFVLTAYVPIFGFWAGILAYAGSIRAIIMGMMEILEDKASSVLITYAFVQIAVLLLIVLSIEQTLGY